RPRGSRAPARRVAARGEHPAAEPGHGRDPRRAAGPGARPAAPAAGAGRVGRAQDPGRRRRPGPRAARRGRVLDAAGDDRPAGHAPPPPGPGRDRHQDRARGCPPPLRPGRAQYPAGAPCRDAGAGPGRPGAALLPAAEPRGARARGRGLAHGAGPSAPGPLAPRCRGLLHPAPGLRPRGAAPGLRLGGPAWRPRGRVRPDPGRAGSRPRRGRGMTAEAPPAIDLAGLLRRLHLPTVRRLYPDLAARAEAEGMAYRDFLALLLAEEVAHRAQTRIPRGVRRARFPVLKTIDEDDFTCQTSLRLSLLGSALSPEFVTPGQGLMFGGPPGTGKTHLVGAIASRAIQNGFDARFTTAADLIDHLSGAAREGKRR